MDRRDEAGLVLADGRAWSVVPGDAAGAEVVNRLTLAMSLRPLEGPVRRLLVYAGGDTLLPEGHDVVRCSTVPPEEGDLAAQQLREVAAVFCRDAEARGGLLLHGALAEREGARVILAGPSGRGKTTASRRLPPPWRSLSDDATLVVLDDHGRYRAHPWPTWSRYLPGRGGGRWDCSRAVSLDAIFFMVKDPELQVARVGSGQATCLLVESGEQAWRLVLRVTDAAQARAERLRRLDNASRFAREVPCFVLCLSLTSSFWRAIDRSLEGL